MSRGASQARGVTWFALMPSSRTHVASQNGPGWASELVARAHVLCVESVGIVHAARAHVLRLEQV